MFRVSKARKTYHHTRGKESERYPNVISGNWNATKPLEIVVSDMTELKTRKHGRIEWTYMLDTYNTERPSTKCGRKSPVQFRTE